MSEDLDIDSIRNIISNRVVNHIHECHSNKIIMYLVISTFPGSGKTTSVMIAIDKSGYNWIYLSGFHDIIKENLEYSSLRDYTYIHLKGKEQEGVCVADEYRKYAKMGISIEPFCETRCPYRQNGCPYYEIKEKLESYPECWAGVHAHVPTYLQKFLFMIRYKKKQMFKHYDVIILDEFPFQVLFNQVIISRNDIDDLRNVINFMEESPEGDFVMKFLNELTLASGDIDINYVMIKSLIENYRGLELHDFLKNYDSTLLWLISNEKIKKPPKNLLFNIMLIHEQNPTLEKLRWILYKHKTKGWMKSGIYVTTSNIHYFKNLPIPVVALDATADIKAWNSLLGDVCLFEKIDMQYKNTYQTKTSAHYPTSTWINIVDGKLELSSTGIKLCELIKEICSRKKNNVLLCSTKKIRKLITDFLKQNYKRKNYRFAIYYNLRSRNKYYEDCDTCIITHEPNIPPLQLEIMKNVIGWNEDLLRELMTKSEIKQAIGRIRQNIKLTPYGRKREKIEVYVLPGAIDDCDKIIDEVKLVPYPNMFLGDLISLRDVIEDTVKKAGKVSFKTLKFYTSDLCSGRILKKELIKMFKENKISDYKRTIKWVYDEEKANKTKYHRTTT